MKAGRDNGQHKGRTGGHGNAEAVALAAQPVAGRHAHGVELHGGRGLRAPAQLDLWPADAQARRPLRRSACAVLILSGST